jgi:hypothetical protein
VVVVTAAGAAVEVAGVVTAAVEVSAARGESDEHAPMSPAATSAATIQRSGCHALGFTALTAEVWHPDR